MAKVNLRNRLKDNNDDNIPPKKGTDNLLNQLDSISVENPFNDLSNNKKIETNENKIEEKKVDNSELLRVGKKEQTDIFKEPDLKDNDKDNSFKNFLKDNKEEQLEHKITIEKQNIFDKLNINKKMFFTALAISGVSAILVINYLNNLIPNVKKINVLIASKYIPEKKVIELSDLAQKEIPEDVALEETIKVDEKFDSKTLVGKIVVTDIFKNEPLLSKRIVAIDESPWLSPVVQKDYRVVSIMSHSLSYIKPKDYVDVFVDVENPLDKGRINEPVIQNALVLAVDGKYKVTQNDHETPGENITIAIPNNLIKLFILLQNSGNFYILLRGQGDNNIIKTKFTVTQLERILSGANKKLEKNEPNIIVKATPKPIIIIPTKTEEKVFKKIIKTVISTPKPPVPTPSVINVTVVNGGHVSLQKVNKPKNNN